MENHFQLGDNVVIYDHKENVPLDFGVLMNIKGDNIVEIDSSYTRQTEHYRLGDGVLMEKPKHV